MNRLKMLSVFLWTLTIMPSVGLNAQKPIQHNNPRTDHQKKPKKNKKEQVIETKSYDVSITCNEPKAFISIDNRHFGTGSGNWFLKEGTHIIQLSAANCVPITDTLIVVGPDSHSFTFTMKKDYSLLPSAVRDLLKNMIYVEGGTYMMGKASDNKQVTVSSFSIGKYEVTQEEWQAVMGSNPSYCKKNEEDLNNPLTRSFFILNNYPVENVSWDDCQEFIAKLNAITGKSFRMPTEAEWEFAARGGNKSRGYKYVGSDSLNDVVWFQENSDSHLHFVGQKTPNELGLYDVCGNVWEWCSGYYSYKDIYGSEEEANTTGSSSNSYRVYRGCGFMTISRHCNVWERHGAKPNERSSERGLRLAL